MYNCTYAVIPRWPTRIRGGAAVLHLGVVYPFLPPSETGSERETANRLYEDIDPR